LHQPVPSTIPVLGSSSHVERGPVVRQSQPPSSGLIGPPGVCHGKLMHCYFSCLIHILKVVL
jgi:hypothetical protein